MLAFNSAMMYSILRALAVTLTLHHRVGQHEVKKCKNNLGACEVSEEYSLPERTLQTNLNKCAGIPFVQNASPYPSW
jgi:hypothetical protein